MKTLSLAFFTVAAIVVTFGSCDTLEWTEPGLLVPRTVDEDPTLPSIYVNGTRLHAETYGNPNDPIIVVLHGGPGGDYRGMLNCNRLAADSFFVVFYDQRGSGLSKRHRREAYASGPKLFIDDLRAVIGHYRQPAQKVILMGHSWGAMLAAAYVNQYPAEISGVILMEPGGLTWSDTEAYIERWSSPEPFDETSNDLVYLDQFVTGVYHNTLDYKAGIKSAADFAEGNKVGNPGPSPFWRFGAVCNAATIEYVKARAFDFTTNLQQYTTRVLFAYSELSEAYGKAWAERLSSAFPNVQLVQINGTGHEMVYWGWESLYPAAKAYLGTIK